MGSADEADSPIAGWTSLVIDLSDVPHGTRMVHVTLDAAGTPIAASDHVLVRDSAGASSPGLIRQESVGGRIDVDGLFRGTHWIMERPDGQDDEDTAGWNHVRRQPTDEEQRRLLALVAEVLSRFW